MSRRRLLLLGLPAAIALLVLGASMLLSPSAISYENYERVRKGMTKDEVEAILGRPKTVVSAPGSLPSGIRWDTRCEWIGNEHLIAVSFQDGRVILKEFDTFVR
jgi:hypothetical protein